MRIVCGGTGFIGQKLVRRWRNQGHDLAVIGRSPGKIAEIFGRGVTALSWQDLEAQARDILPQTDVVVNLCGAGIADRPWTPRRRQQILDSRIKPTRRISEFVAQNNPGLVLLNASAVGIHLPGTFLSRVCREWEDATGPARQAGVRVVLLRFGYVLGGDGGMLARLLPVYRRGLGGRLGRGDQPFPWIAIQDLCEAIDFLTGHAHLCGPVDLVSPQAVTQEDFARAMAEVLNRPLWGPVPAGVLKILLGQMARELLLSGVQRAPEQLKRQGFVFRYPDLKQYLLQEIL